MTTRTLSNWRTSPEGADRPPGRPRYGARARWRALRAVARAWRRQGAGRVGGRTVAAALDEAGIVVPPRLLWESMRRLKEAARRRARSRRERERVRVEVLGRDVMWSVDGTHLGRDQGGRAIVGRVVRDAATTAMPAIAVGPPASGKEIVAQLEEARRERGGPPLVLSRDNGSEYACGAVERWCSTNGVVCLRNVPHTPQHNPWVENANGELKEVVAARAHRFEALSERERSRDAMISSWRARLEDAARVLDRGRVRATRGYRTAAQLDAIYPRGDHLVDRARFYEAACSAVSKAVLGLESSRARRRAEREAIFATMQAFGLITRTRGGVPIPARKPESVS